MLFSLPWGESPGEICSLEWGKIQSELAKVFDLLSGIFVGEYMSRIPC